MKKINRRDFVKSAAAGAALAGIGSFGTKIFAKENLNQKGDIKMAYEWKFNKRPYTDDEAKNS
ncbi:MAG: twin-arginine translocation signal domain-containing protein [Ignavibacteria bacterium]|nr:twin-arginine translocation signal domain-containing protein [Ignavibacteria bacterium]